MTDENARLYRGVSLAERQAERRHRLISAAFAVYAREGYAKSTVRLICAEAGLTPRYFYESFADPTALLLAAFDAALAELDTILRAALAEASPTPEARLRAVLRAYFARLKNDAAVARVFLADMHGVSPTVDARFRAALHDFGRSFAEILPRVADTPPGFADGLAGGLNQIALAWSADGYTWNLDDVVQSAELLFAGMW